MIKEVGEKIMFDEFYRTIINYFLNGFCVMISNTNKIIFSIMWKQKMKN